jgi:hypothetical protein
MILLSPSLGRAALYWSSLSVLFFLFAFYFLFLARKPSQQALTSFGADENLLKDHGLN